jgi:RNA-directed DNA polymerase
MDWSEYKIKFEKDALAAGYEEKEIQNFLSYAKKLRSKNLPVIYDQEHLALLLGFKVDYLRKISNSPIHFYRRFEIPKRNGKSRVIHEPLPNLKEIQKWILFNILNKCSVSSYAKAFVKKRSVRDNAHFHKNKEMVLKLDLVDFFGTIKFERIYSLYRQLGYSEEIATTLTHLCSLKRKLPQGAPTSPALSNIVSKKLDKRIFGFCNKNQIRYTRYADDMTFSGNFKAGIIIKFVRTILIDDGLKLNEKKTRLMKRHQSQRVTGIVVNEKLQVPRELRREIRKNVFFIKKYGLSSHLEKIECEKSNYVRHLLGKVEFASFINPNDQDLNKYKKILHSYLES